MSAIGRKQTLSGRPRNGDLQTVSELEQFGMRGAKASMALNQVSLF